MASQVNFAEVASHIEHEERNLFDIRARKPAPPADERDRRRCEPREPEEPAKLAFERARGAVEAAQSRAPRMAHALRDLHFAPQCASF